MKEIKIDLSTLTPKTKSVQPKILGRGLQTLIESVLNNFSNPEKDFVNPFGNLSDIDFDPNDAVNKYFLDNGGCKKIIFIIDSGDKEILSKVYDNIKTIRKAHRLNIVRNTFANINMAKSGSSVAENQIEALNKLNYLIKDTIDDGELKNLNKIKNSILAGKENDFDVASARLQKVFSENMPEPKNTRLAYTYLNTQDGEPYQMCPKARFQIGKTLPIEVSKCRDQCIDSRVTKDGKVTCAYADWIKLADNYVSLNNRLDVYKQSDNAEYIGTIEPGERNSESENSFDARNQEQRIRNKYSDNNISFNNKNTETKLEETKEVNFGHQGETDKRIQDSIENIKEIEEKINVNIKSEDDLIETIESLLDEKRLNVFDKKDIAIKTINEWIQESRKKQPKKYRV